MATASQTEGAEVRSPRSVQGTQRRRPWRSYLLGASGIFDFFGNTSWSRVSTVKNRTDAEALAGDWCAVGDDLRRAMGRYAVAEAPRRS